MLRIVWILGNLCSVDWTINYSGHPNIIINVQNRVPIYRMYLYLCMPTHIAHKHLMNYAFKYVFKHNLIIIVLNYKNLSQAIACVFNIII